VTHDSERLQRVEEKLDDVRVSVAEIAGMLPALCRRIERLEREIWGNGGIGLSTRVNALIWLASGIAGLVVVLLGNTVRVVLGW